VFHALFLLILLAVFLLPITVAGDGTAKGQLQISLTYSLGVVIALISTTTIWLSCAVLAREIESYNLHLVMTKPAPPWLVWLGKWLGVLVMHLALLAFAGVIIWGLVLWRIERSGFSESELERLRAEAMVGRRAFRAEAPDFTELARREYHRRVQEGLLDRNADRNQAMYEILRQVKARAQEVPYNGTRVWVFRNVRMGASVDRIFVKYRHYVGDSRTRGSQKFTEGLWGVRDPRAGDDGRFAMLPQRVLSGAFHELVLPAAAVDADGTLVLTYTNEGRDGGSVMFQHDDGPVLLVRVTGFTANYLRALVLAMFQIAFLAALGCTFGAALSTPVAVFTAVSYLVLSFTVQGAVSAPVPDLIGGFHYKGPVDRGLHYLAIAVSHVIVSVDDFDAVSDLARGRLIEISRLAAALGGQIGLRGGLLAAFGMYVLTRRELGTVVRK